MINKVWVFPCVNQTNEMGYEGPILTLACSSNVSFVLLFPISEDNASLINYILEHKPSEYNTNLNIIGIYKTMIDSWEEGGRHLSGIYIDMDEDPESKTEKMSTKIIISDDNSGDVDSIIKVNFIHAILLAAMERREIIVSGDLLRNLMPDDNYDEEDGEDNSDDSINDENTKKFPVDKDILDIAKKIMSGKIK